MQTGWSGTIRMFTMFTVITMCAVLCSLRHSQLLQWFVACFVIGLRDAGVNFRESSSKHCEHLHCSKHHIHFEQVHRNVVKDSVFVTIPGPDKPDTLRHSVANGSPPL